MSRLGFAGLGSARLGSARLSSARPGPAQPGPTRAGRHGQARRAVLTRDSRLTAHAPWPMHLD
ncbi:hypothetical protein C6T58_13790 [Burkholderia multivorans]|nr:hypothetical protein C6Q11_12520 [Burkholderia multivorans]PRG80963.1 hypothetical protein C6T58_13790 [Burkholderia multivorans]